MAIISASDLKTYLGISSSTDDSLITALITAATKIIEAYTQRDFEVGADTTRYFTPGVDTGYAGWRAGGGSWNDDWHPGGGNWVDHSSTLFLDEDLAQTPTTITNGDGIVVTSAQYVLIDRNRPPYRAIKLKGSTGLVWTYTNDPEYAISVVGRWGWSVTPPDDIVQAARRLSGFLYRQKDMQTYDATAFSELGVIRIKHRIPEDIMAMLDPYRRMS